MARHFRSGFDEMVRQAELEEMEKRWAEENARIMREHPNPPPEEAHDAAFASGLPMIEETPPAKDEAASAEALMEADQPMLPLGSPSTASEAAAAPTEPKQGQP